MALPGFQNYLAQASGDDNDTPVANPPPQPTGTGNWFTAGLGSGFHQALSEAGSAGEAVGRAIGADHFADNARAFADAQRQTAATYARPDLENGSLFDPASLAYRVTQTLPMWAGGLAAAGAATLAAPESAVAGLVAGGAAMLPSAIGGNVQRREDYQGTLDQSNAAKAIALGIPEAAIQGILPMKLESGLLKGVGGGFVGSVAKAAGIQAPVAAASEWLTQQMGDPNRSLADRAQDVITAGLTGGVTGGATAGLLHPLSPQHNIAKKPAGTVTVPDLLQASVVPTDPQPIANPLPAPGDIVKARTAATLGDRVNALQNAPTMQGPGLPPAPGVTPDAPFAGRPVGNLEDRVAALGRPMQGPGLPPPVEPAPPGAPVFGQRLPTPEPTPEVPFDWEAQRKQLQQGKAFDPSLKGPFGSQDELNNTVAENLFNRLADGKTPPARLLNAGKLLGVIDDKGEPTPAFAQKAQEIIAAKATPPGIAPDGVVEPTQTGPTGAYTPPDRLEKAAIDLKHQGRWDALEAVRTRLLGDNLSDPDVQGLLSQTSDLQNRLLKPGRGGPKQIEAATRALQTQVDARGADAGPNPTGAPVDKRAPAVGPDPSPAAAAVIAKAAPAATTAPVTTEAKVKAARAAKAALPVETPEPAPPAVSIEFRGKTYTGRSRIAAILAAAHDTEVSVDSVHDQVVPETKPAPPATVKEQTVQDAVASGEAPAGVTAPEIADRGTNQQFAQAFARQSAKEGGKTASIGVTREQMAREARQAAAPKTPMDLNNERGMGPPALSQDEQDAFNELPPREQAIQRDARYWEYMRTAYPEDIEARAQAAERLDASTRELTAPQPKDEATAAAINDTAQSAVQDQAARQMVAPQTKEARAKAAREAMIAKREPVDVAKRGDIENQRTPEVVKPKLAKTVDDVQEAEPARELDPRNKEDAVRIARQQGAERLPPAVDPSTLSGFARDGRRVQADARRENLNNGLRARLAMVESGRRPVVQVTQKIAAQLQSARDALTKLEQSGAIIPRHEDFAGKDQRLQQLIAQHREQLDLVERGARLGGMEGLREVPRDYFGTDLYDEMSGHVTPQTEKNLEQHAIAESQLQDAAALARGERPLMKYSTPPTQHDVDLAAIINSTGRMSDALGHIRDNGTSIQAREMARILERNGAGAGTIAMSDKAPSTDRQLKDGEHIAGGHDVDANHTNVYDGGGVEQTVLHEAAHAATEHALRANTPAAKEITALFERVKAATGESDVYGLTNPSEFVAEAMSNPQFQQALKSMPVSTGSRIGDMWHAFKNIVFKALGMPDRIRTLFDQVMDGTNRLMGENVAEASRNVNMLVQRGGQQFSEMSTQAGNILARKVQREFDDKTTKMGMGLRSIGLGWLNGEQIRYNIEPHIPSVGTFMDLQNHRTIRTNTLSKHLVDAYKTVMALPEKAREAWNKIAQASIQNIDGSKPWKDNTWLHQDPQAAILQQEHAKIAREFDVLRRTPGGMDAYQKSVDANEVSRHLRDLHLMYDMYKREYGSEPPWTGYASDPIRDYEANDQLHDNPAMAKQQLDARKLQMRAGMAAKATDVETLINSLKVKEQAGLSGALKMTPEQSQELRAEIVKQEANHASLSGLVTDIGAMDARSQQGAYFHLGRDGDHFVTGHVIADKNGVPDDAALQKIQQRMEAAGFGEHVISRGIGQTSIYLRMEGQAQREEAFHLFQQLRSEGLLDNSPSKPVARGVAADTSIYKSVGPQWMRQAIAAVEAQQPDFPLDAPRSVIDAITAAHDQQKREMVRSLMDMLPDTSITKVYAKRQNVQGFNDNMMSSYKASAIANARGLSNMSIARELGLAAVKMNDELEAKNKSATITGRQLTAISQGLGELTLRNKLYQAHVPSTFMDTVRKMVHTFQIGASPAYFFTLMSQIPTLTLPELAKTHGYARSAMAMGKSTSEALQIMSAVMKGKDGVTFGLRRSDLVAAGIKPATVDFIMHLAGRGAFNEGGFTEQMAGHDTDSTMGKITQYANMLGRYSEQFPRVLTALAARDLHESQPAKAGGMNVHDFALKKVMDSQFNWNPELNARQTTRSSSFGAMGPLVNQFMGFQTRMTEKLYREVGSAFGKGEEGRQARVWLAGHAAAVTMLAGTLGLPMVSVAASVYDRLSDWIENKDNVDVTASYRNFLAKSFGKEFGEAIARGAPRLTGMDFDHLGEGSLLPGVPGGPVVSKFLQFATEKRKLEDAEKDWLKNMAGSSMGFIFNGVAAARDLSNGDVMDAMVKTMPEILKGPMEAYRLSERGFVDKKGAHLPITANARDVMMTALGIDPAKEAEYDEVNKVAIGLKTLALNRSQNIMRHLMLAESPQNRGDQGMMQTWEREAMQFQMDHPGMRSPLGDFQRAMMLHARNAEVARGMGTPLGVQPRDLMGRGMTGFGNFRQGEQ
jgi:hypothetical protein